LCVLLNGHLYSSDMDRLTFHQVQKELIGCNPEKLFVKPAEGSGGKNICIFHNHDGNYVTQDNIFFDKKFLDTIGKKQDYIIQPGISQDPEIAKVYSKSVNTFRMITENKDGSARIICAILRLGRGQKEVDNASSGGLFLKIDTKNGNVGDYAWSLEGEKFSRHPDTNFEFPNFTISRWAEIQKFVIESANKQPFFPHFGWDIALTVNGPIVIEANKSPGLDSLQISYGGLKDEFGIMDPTYYWKNSRKMG